MAKRIFGIAFGLILAVSLFAQTDTQQKAVSLSLEDCIAIAMKNNLGVAIQVLNPEIQDIGVRQAKEKWLPTLSFDFGRSDTQQASYSWLDSTGAAVVSLNNAYTVTVDQEVPGGGNFSARLNSSKYDTNRTGITINPSFRADLRFTFNQPLLRNFGFASQQQILVAKNRLSMSEEDLKRALQTTVFSVEQQYWNLVGAIENLRVAEQSLALAQDLLEKNKRGVEVGTMAPIEIINAEAQVAEREANILTAELAVRNEEDRLKLTINLQADMADAENLQITPTDSPTYEQEDIGLEQAIATALQYRPDLASARIGISNSELDLRYAKNQLLPNLDLSVSYWSPGVSGDRLILDPDNPLAPPIGKVPGGISDSFKDVFGFEYKNWSIGITLNFPLNTVVSRATHAQAQVNLEQAMLQLREQEMQIYTDIKIAVRNVETAYKAIQARQVARELAERQLEAEEEKLKVGLTTNRWVLQYQTDLASARLNEINAIIQYNLALASLELDMGTSLEKKKIQLTQFNDR
jgi:outer membrane protein TolC